MNFKLSQILNTMYYENPVFPDILPDLTIANISKIRNLKITITYNVNKIMFQNYQLRLGWTKTHE